MPQFASWFRKHISTLALMSNLAFSIHWTGCKILPYMYDLNGISRRQHQETDGDDFLQELLLREIHVDV